MGDGGRFSYLVPKIVRKRLTYDELTGQLSEPEGSKRKLPRRSEEALNHSAN
jgi:hypothetical protein